MPSNKVRPARPRFFDVFNKSVPQRLTNSNRFLPKTPKDDPTRRKPPPVPLALAAGAVYNETNP